MSYLQKPAVHHPELATNSIGLNRRDYEGAITTLCAGCGHDAIGSALMHACYESDLPPHRIAKLSGIGCSSKLPTYFLGNSHGFNSVHGRMPSVVTGANLANRELIYIGLSGDGDTGSIGFGQFSHVMRRGVNMLYMVANNGVYGLTKGQFSATADEGSFSKGGSQNPFSAIDLVQTALQIGATFVARSFSGDKAQLVPLIKAAIAHPGFALIDCLSPCVTFNNHEGSTKSYEYIREHEAEVAIADFVPDREQITAEYGAGKGAVVQLHDGSYVRLKKVAEDYDATDRIGALAYLHEHEKQGEIVTGLLYMEPQPREMHEMLKTTAAPLNALTERELCPGQLALDKVNKSHR